MISAAGACHGPMPYRFHEDRFPFDRIDENQEQECANCDIIQFMMSSSASLSLSHSASSILSTSSSRSIKPPPPPLIETDDSASASSSKGAAPAPPVLTIHGEQHQRYLLLSSTSIQQPLGFRESLLQMTRHASTRKLSTITHIETDDSASSSSAAVAAPVLTIHEEQQRRLLLGLYHGATCCRSYSLQHVGACPDHVRCAAVKRLYSHISHCRSKKECMVPGCTKARKVWAHFGRCIDQDCHICTVIPNRSEEKLSLSKKYKKKTTTTATKKPAAANTSSSSKTAAFQMSSLVAAIAASMPAVPMQDEGRPPLSPTRSFTAPFYCYI